MEERPKKPIFWKFVVEISADILSTDDSPAGLISKAPLSPPKHDELKTEYLGKKSRVLNSLAE
jgi:hypothetical protein